MYNKITLVVNERIVRKDKEVTQNYKTSVFKKLCVSTHPKNMTLMILPFNLSV